MKDSMYKAGRTLFAILWLVVGIANICLLPCVAQIAATGLTGEVTDPSGALIPAANVTVTMVSNGTVRQAVTNGKGVYYLPDLSPGTYNLTIEKQGFSSTTVKGVVIYVGQPGTQNIQLSVGDVGTKMEVSAEAPLLNTTNATVGTEIEGKVLTEIPLNGRNFLQLNLLSPGVTYDKNGSVASSKNANINPTTTGFNVSGFPGSFNQINWDGTTMKEWQYATNALTPSVDALQEFQAATGTYSAAYGTDAAGQINLVTKSGTNGFHGSLYEFVRNNIFDAKNYFVTTTKGAPPYRRNQFGGTVGGPILRNHTFFFISYDGFRQSKQVPVLANLPTLAQLQGQISDLVPPGQQLTNPFTGQPFPGNNIPQNLIPASLENFLLTGGKGGTPWFPVPNSNAPGFNYAVNAHQGHSSNQWIGKFDHRFSTKTTSFVKYARETFNRAEPIVNPNATAGTNTYARSFAANVTSALKPNLLVDFTFGWLEMSRDFFASEQNRINVAGELGIQGTFGAPNSWVTPSWSVNGFNLDGNGYSAPTGTDYRSYDFNPALTWNVGKHVLNVGADITRYYDTFIQLICPSSCTSFDGSFTGQSLGDFLLQTTSFLEVTSTGFDPKMRYTGQGYYAQDDWKVSSNLTLNLGFRYESLGVPVSENNSLSNIFLGRNCNTTNLVATCSGTPAIITVGTPTQGIKFDGVQQALIPAPAGTSIVSASSVGMHNSLVQGPARNYMPRVGFAYRIPRGKDAVLRGGFGLYSNRVNDNRWVDIALNVPFVGLVDEAFSASNFQTFNWQAPFAGTAGLAAPLGFLGNSPKYKNAQVKDWSLTLEKNFLDTLFSVGYVGNTAAHLPNWASPNQAAPGPGPFAPRQLYPNFGGIIWQENEGSSKYNSLQVKLQRRYANGLGLLAGYTFSKATDNGSGDINGEGPSNQKAQDVRNLNGDRGLSLQDARHRFVFSYIYEIPLGRGHRFATQHLADAVLGGWQINGITTLQSGNPVFITQACNRANTDTGALRPDLVGPWRLDSSRPSAQLVNEFFNTSAFVNVCPDISGPGPFTFGNAGRNIVIGPGIKDWDFGVFKNIGLGGEHRSLQFRTEIFNLFNHPIFAQPGGSAGTPQFGRISATSIDSREIQFALKLLF